MRMIPKIIHQTWKTHQVPPNCTTLVETWKRQNPNWDYKLWSDADLDAFVAEHYPAFLGVFRAYPKGIQRADAGRYLLLEHFGGIYADIDTECLRACDLLCEEDRVILCEEPRGHWPPVISVRGLSRLLFNGTMASPKGHPFWRHLMKEIENNRSTSAVLDSTGPLILTASVEKYSHPEKLSISSSHLFCGKEVNGIPVPDERRGDYGHLDVSVHHWAGSWFTLEKYPFKDKVESYVRSWIYNARKPRQFKPSIDHEKLQRPLPPSTEHQEISVLIPVRDAVPHLEKCIALLGQLDWPKKKLHITFCEGDSVDGTTAMLQKIVTENQHGFGSMQVIHRPVGTKIGNQRWLPKLQMARRGGLAMVRNYLIDCAILPSTDWALWIDVDVDGYTPDVLKKLLAQREKIVVPHCLRGDGSNLGFDLNSFATIYDWRDTYYFKHIVGGLYQPPQDSGRRLYMHDVRYLDRLHLNSVGGTMLLVHATVHRAGIRFPHLPYKDLIETEGFGQLAFDSGITPVGLPNLLIYHPV